MAPISIQSATSAAKAVAVAGRALGKQLRSAPGAVTLLLSGGSAGRIHTWLAAHPEELPARAAGWRLGLVDERWGARGHAVSNARAARESGLVEVLLARGARFEEVLDKALSPAAAAEAYEAWLARRLEASRVLATVGIGGDGHTLGVLPQVSDEVFSRLFPQGRLFVAYEHPGETAHRHRLTLTPSAAHQLSWVVGVALGDGKRPVLEQLEGEATAPLWRFPAGMLSGVEGILLTDAPPARR